jgi:hypothetical protein
MEQSRGNGVVLVEAGSESSKMGSRVSRDASHLLVHDYPRLLLDVLQRQLQWLPISMQELLTLRTVLQICS